MLTKSQFIQRHQVIEMRANQSRHFCSGFPLKSYCLKKYEGSFISLDHRINLLEMFTTKRHKNKTKVIILANNNRYQVRNEPIKSRSKYIQLASLAEKVARVLSPNHKAYQSRPKDENDFRHPIKIHSVVDIEKGGS